MSKLTPAIAEVLATGNPASLQEAVARAAALLREGALVALPTETVYGLAANALNAQAVEQIYTAKGRPSNNPIIVHVASFEMAHQCVSHWPAMADALARAFWPGPLTMVMKRSALIPDRVTAGGDTVGIRWPSHPVMQKVIQACGFPLAAPSANLSNRISPTTAAHVAKDLGKRIRLILDGGPAQVGVESTVLDLTQTPPRILRPGMIHAESIKAITGQLATQAGTGTGALKSPGMLKKHYSPRARLVVLKWQSAEELQRLLASQGMAPQKTHVLVHTSVPIASGCANICRLAHDPASFARALYAELHRCDEMGAECIVVEAPPEASAWQAVADRLQRASAPW